MFLAGQHETSLISYHFAAIPTSRERTKPIIITWVWVLCNDLYRIIKNRLFKATKMAAELLIQTATSFYCKTDNCHSVHVDISLILAPPASLALFLWLVACLSNNMQGNQTKVSEHLQMCPERLDLNLFLNVCRPYNSVYSYSGC